MSRSMRVAMRSTPSEIPTHTPTFRLWLLDEALAAAGG